MGVPQLNKSKDEVAPNPVVHHHFPQQTHDEYLECTMFWIFPQQNKTQGQFVSICNMGVSENNVPLNPMVNDHYPY